MAVVMVPEEGVQIAQLMATMGGFIQRMQRLMPADQVLVLRVQVVGEQLEVSPKRSTFSDLREHTADDLVAEAEQMKRDMMQPFVVLAGKHHMVLTLHGGGLPC